MTPEEQKALDDAAAAAAEVARLDAEEAARLAKMTEEEKFNERVQKAADEKLKDFKAKVDAAYKVRDEALAKAEALAQKQREAELASLKEQGKHKEAYELEIANERAEKEALKLRNIELTRDVELKGKLSAFKFRSENASNMAYREIVEQLVRDEKGEWVHKNGASIADYVKTFSEDESNAFLFEVKRSSGNGSGDVTLTKPGDTSNGSLFKMKQSDVIKRAQAKVSGKPQG